MQRGDRRLVVGIRLGAQVGDATRDVDDEGAVSLVGTKDFPPKGRQSARHRHGGRNSQALTFLSQSLRILAVAVDRRTDMARFRVGRIDRDLQRVRDLTPIRLSLDQQAGELACAGSHNTCTEKRGCPPQPSPVTRSVAA